MRHINEQKNMARERRQQSQTHGFPEVEVDFLVFLLRFEPIGTDQQTNACNLFFYFRVVFYQRMHHLFFFYSTHG